MNKKSTQGYRKFKQLFGDIRRNICFLELLDDIREEFEKNFWDLVEIYTEPRDKDCGPEDSLEKIVGKTINNLDKKSRKKISKTLELLAQKYGIDYGLFCYIIAEHIMEKNPKFSSCTGLKLTFTPDMCLIRDNYLFRHPNETRLGAKCYPVRIEIHNMASKNDVLDFINKNWKNINAYIEWTRDKPLKIRQRKHSRRMIDFIWNNHKLPRKDIMSLVRKEFKFVLGYEEIAKIISIEKKRRLGRLS